MKKINLAMRFNLWYNTWSKRRRDCHVYGVIGLPLLFNNVLNPIVYSVWQGLGILSLMCFCYLRFWYIEQRNNAPLAQLE